MEKEILTTILTAVVKFINCFIGQVYVVSKFSFLISDNVMFVLSMCVGLWKCFQ